MACRCDSGHVADCPEKRRKPCPRCARPIVRRGRYGRGAPSPHLCPHGVNCTGGGRRCTKCAGPRASVVVAFASNATTRGSTATTLGAGVVEQGELHRAAPGSSRSGEEHRKELTTP